MVEPLGKPGGSDERKQCARRRIRATPVEPRRERRRSDDPVKRAVVDSLRLKRCGAGLASVR